jgi:hypothetical protein
MQKNIKIVFETLKHLFIFLINGRAYTLVALDIFACPVGQIITYLHTTQYSNQSLDMDRV